MLACFGSGVLALHNKRLDGRHPLADGIRQVTIVGIRDARIDRGDGTITLVARGLRTAS